MYGIIKELALPPGSLCVLLGIAFILVALRRRAAGLTLGASALAMLWLLATPIAAARLSSLVQTIPAASEEMLRASDAQAIVVLSAGLSPFNPEYGGPSVDETTLQRLRYAAHVQRATDLPLLVSGGVVPGAGATLAGLMKASLAADFNVDTRWIEDASTDTHENAVFSAEILKSEQIHRIILVTHASHMPRALRAFANAGLDVVPAPTAFIQPPAETPLRFVPLMSGLRDSRYAIYELLGRVWYALRH